MLFRSGAYSRSEEDELVKAFHKILFGCDPSPSFPSGVLPLYRDPAQDAIIAPMPECNELGILATWVPPGHPRISRLGGASSSRAAGGAAGASSSAPAAGAGQPARAAGTGRRRRRLQTLGELEASGAFRLLNDDPQLQEHPLLDDDVDDEEDRAPLSARVRRMAAQQPPATPSPATAPETSAGATPTTGPARTAGPNVGPISSPGAAPPPETADRKSVV